MKSALPSGISRLSILLGLVLTVLMLSSSPVSAGAPWAFQPLPPVTPPLALGQSNPIDALILAKLLENKLKPAPPADRRVLLRRAYFDLTGLPPSPSEIETGLKTPLEEVVDRLLASPSYGERYGKHWLDLVRYADTGGFEADPTYEQAWRYRDYVIRSFNSNKSFDQFVKEQIAGDEISPEDPDASIATALFSIGPVMQESAMIPNQLEYEWLTDATDTACSAFLGLTFGCARCHNHKYDPISQKDYFALQAIFAGSDRVYPEKIREQRIKSLNGIFAEKPLPKEFEHDPRCQIRTEKEAGLRLVHLDSPMEIHRLHRGELSKPKEVVGPDFPEAIHVPNAPNLAGISGSRRRAAFAEWLTSPENPLTPRVIVNRVWGWHFGNGLVRTPNNFGAQGEPPTHPELLDWLARDFVDHGWDLKRLHKLIMLSKTYQQAGSTDTTASQIDPENRLLSHFPPQRLDGEGIWDTIHFCSGTLNQRQFGPSVVPPLTDEELTGLFSGKTKWQVTKDPAEHSRRGVYLFVRRIFLFPFLDAFDPPEMMTSCPRRFQTTVPTQALTLLNSATTQKEAHAFAERLLRETGPEPEKLLTRAWLIAFGRSIHPDELNKAEEFLARQNSDGGETGSRKEALAELCLALFNTNEFVYVD